MLISSDWRSERGAAQNIIASSTGAAKAVCLFVIDKKIDLCLIRSAKLFLI
jgi:glyceraldehyde-3-phosphate dehydrogenase/erythrose-4-phosphate dehydrogenase